MKIAKQIAEEAVEMYKQDRKNKIPSTTFEPVVPVVYIKAAVEKGLRELEIPERPKYRHWHWCVPCAIAETTCKECVEDRSKQEMWDAWHKAIYGEEENLNYPSPKPDCYCAKDGSYKCEYCSDANKPTEPKHELPEKLNPDISQKGIDCDISARIIINQLIDYLRAKQ